MPRPIKCRKVCCLPPNSEFRPVGCLFDVQDTVVMSVDEYEAIRLIDHEGFTQEECGQYMKIARTTVQEVYGDARKKLAIALVEGKPLKIDGGRYELCNGKEKTCRCGGCKAHKYSKSN